MTLQLSQRVHRERESSCVRLARVRHSVHEPTAARIATAHYSSYDFFVAHPGRHASLRRRRSAKLFGGRHLCQIWTNQRRAARTRSALGGLPKKSCSRFALRCSRKKSSKIFSACGGLSLSALTIWRLWRAARSCGLHSTGIHQNIRLRHRTQTRKYVAISSFCHCKSKFFGACGELGALETLLS